MARSRRAAGVRYGGEGRKPEPAAEVRSGVVRERLAGAFLRRSTRLLQRLSAEAPAAVLEAALAAPSDVGGVARILSEMAAVGVALDSVDPLAEAMARGVEAKRELIARSGGALSSGEVAAALGITRQAVDKRRERRKLLALPSGSGDHLYPACQFTAHGVVPHLGEVLEAFRVSDPWTELAVLLGPSPALGGRSALEALRSGDVDGAVAVAGAFGEQGG